MKGRVLEICWYIGNSILFVLIPLIRVKFIVNENLFFYFLMLIIVSFVFFNIASFLNGKKVIAFKFGFIENNEQNKDERRIHFVLSLIIYFLLLYFIMFKFDSLLE